MQKLPKSLSVDELDRLILDADLTVKEIELKELIHLRNRLQLVSKWLCERNYSVAVVVQSKLQVISKLIDDIIDFYSKS